MQYFPHEVIKKATWFINHPRYIKFQLQVSHLLRKALGMREAVASNDLHDKPRITVVVSSMLDDVADNIIGRQVYIADSI